MDHRIKLAVVAPSLITGGAETMIARLVSNIDVDKFNLKVVVLRGNKEQTLIKNLIEKNIDITILSNAKEGCFKTLRALNNFFREFKPQVIHSHISGTIYSLPWVFFHKCGLIHTIHTKPDAEFSNKINVLLKVFCRLKKLKMVAVSKKNFELAKSFFKLSDSDAYFVNNPVPIDKYFNRKKERKNITFINVSRQDVNKNQQMIITAFSCILQKYPLAKLVLVGNGNQHQSLIQQAAKLGISERVDFVGEVFNTEEYLADGDVYISSSHREGLPLSMLEAMAAELPIISTDVGGCSDIVDGNGILIPDDDTDAMYNAMLYLIENEDVRIQYGKQSLINVVPYDVKTTAIKYQEIYQKEIKK